MLRRFKSLGVAMLGLAAAILFMPSYAGAQVPGGQAKAVQATVFGLLSGSTTTLAATGVMPAGSYDALQASSVTGAVPSLLAGESLHAATIGNPDGMFSEASLGGLGMAVLGNTISADLVMARARALVGGVTSADSIISGLAVNGIAIPVTGAPNQSVPLPGGQLILNEQRTGASGAAVNALHLVVTGVVDVVVGSASAVTP